jgi:dipeptidyl aminopeptidase/acylaminoacyl peptidase
VFDASANPVQISPDGKRYLVIVTRGDLERNGNWVEFITGRTNDLNVAVKVETAANLFTSSGEQNPLRSIRWMGGGERVAFLWNNGSDRSQVMVLNLQTHELAMRTNHATNITGFDISLDGRTILFAADRPSDESESRRMLLEGFAIPSNTSLYDLLRGHLQGDPAWRPDVFVSTASHPEPRRLSLTDRGIFFDSTFQIMPQVSPDGRWGVVTVAPESPPKDWEEYSGSATAHYVATAAAAARRDPSGPASVKQYWVVDLDQAAAHPLWNAPWRPAGTLVWSRDSRSVLISPTFLPVREADTAGLSGAAAAEVDLATGQFKELPLPRHVATDHGFRGVRWVADARVELSDPLGLGHDTKENASLQFEKRAGGWVQVTHSYETERKSLEVQIELRQNPNSPPALFANARSTGRDRLILDLNPQLHNFSLGKVEGVQWSDSEGRLWTGKLYYPVHYSRGKRFPLVIQSSGNPVPAEFSLRGIELTTAYAAQPLANRDIAVLQVGNPDNGAIDQYVGKPREYEIMQLGLEGAIGHCVEVGLAANDKVGLLGFSRTGGYVEYVITHSRLPFAAAVVADNQDRSYVQYLMYTDGDRAGYASSIGAEPFGDRLKAWATGAPGFNADRVHTPLRMERSSGGLFPALLASWELFSNLRYLKKPVELFVVPDIEHSTHRVELPIQQLASQDGTTDWFDFWLNGHEDGDPKKVAQYVRWHRLRELYEADTERQKK